MSGRDHWYNKAKQEGYRSRAAYKLAQLDDEATLLPPGGTVVDLGAAPGGWLQVAAERVGHEGTVVGVDFQRIDELDTEATVETIRGDMTDDDTRERVIEAVGEADTVLSDMAPNMSGEYSLDHARSVHLARQAFETARELLGPGGDLAVKVFDGQDVAALRADLDDEFEYVREMRPPASRDESAELYLVAKRRYTAPVRPGEELTATVEDLGDEGDGIVRVEGFTLFVPDASVDEEVRIRVTELRSRFGFAERID